MQEPDRNGKTVYGKKGSYSNLNKLGEGGFKVAYNATDDQHGNEVVVVFPTTCNGDVAQHPDYHQNVVLKSLGDEMHMLKNIVHVRRRKGIDHKVIFNSIRNRGEWQNWEIPIG